MSILLFQYIRLEAKVRVIRTLCSNSSSGYLSCDEDSYLDEMDALWWKMSKADRDLLNERKTLNDFLY